MCRVDEKENKGKQKGSEKKAAPLTFSLQEIERKCMKINCKICVSIKTKQAEAEARMKALSPAGRH